VFAARNLEALRRTFAGDLLTNDSDGYAEARRSFNAMVDRRPAVIAQCDDSSDVALAIAFAREQQLPISVRGGGHSVAGYGLVDRGVVIDLRRMRRVRIDARSRTARAQGGCIWSDLDPAGFAHGLAVVGGVYGDTGIGGLTLGGGIGFLMGTQGLTCDNLVGAEIVTAEGGIREVSDGDDPELLWALRGGGGNFGVVTRFDYRLHEVGEMFGGEVVVPLDDGEVLARYAQVQSGAPDELLVMAFLRRMHDGTAAVLFQVAWQGDPADGEPLLSEILHDAPRLEIDLSPLTYLDVQAINTLLPFTLRHYWKSAFVPDLTPDVAEAILQGARRCEPGTDSGILIEPIHGEARRYGHDHAAFGEREARFHVTALGIWPDEANDNDRIAWVRGVHASIAATGADGTYVNYSSPDETAARARIAYPPLLYDRLRTVKRRLDPDNVFRSNVNIAP
jgi:FAD/FMN-containing dehydrogenase